MKIFYSFIFTFLSILGFSQNNLQFLSATTGAACQSIKYYNDYVFTGTGSTLRSYYVGTGATTPYDSVFEYRYMSQIIRMTVNDNYLYVAANYDGMTKWDISNPANPVKVFDIPCDSVGMATQGVSIKGDTIFLAQSNKMSAYKDFGSSFIKIGNLGYAPFGGTITGVAVKNNLCAYTVSQIGSQNGVYLYNSNNFSFISFSQQAGFFTENVIWGKNNNLLHVMGGTNSINGHFYTLNVSNPLSPQVIFNDTVLGVAFGFAMAVPYNAENINDTIFVATWGGLKQGDIANCYIRVYDATNPANVHLLTYINAGLWHFDMAVHYPKVYVASEWYGIKTLDISDIMNPVDDGKTLTGGWNLSSDAYGNYLTVANEGYGFKLYDISNSQNPLLLKVNNDPGFCFHANFSSNGNHIYTTNGTYQGFRVYKTDSLIQTGFIQQAVCNGRFIVYQDRIFSKLDNKIIIINVSNPYNPLIDSTINITFNDMAEANGKLYVSTNDSVLAYDISGNNFQKIASVPLGSNQNAPLLAAFNNNIYVYITNKGLTSFELTYDNSDYLLTEVFSSSLVNGQPNYIAADPFGVYLAYRLKGLYALDKQTFTQIAYYRGSLDYRKYADQYGVRNLFCKNNKIFLVEYFAQTSILTMDSTLTALGEFMNKKSDIKIYPNPSKGTINITIDTKNFSKSSEIKIYNIKGNLVYKIIAKSAESEIDISSLSNGVYFINVCDINGIIGVKQIIIQK